MKKNSQRSHFYTVMSWNLITTMADCSMFSTHIARIRVSATVRNFHKRCETCHSLPDLLFPSIEEKSHHLCYTIATTCPKNTRWNGENIRLVTEYILGWIHSPCYNFFHWNTWKKVIRRAYACWLVDQYCHGSLWATSFTVTVVVWPTMPPNAVLGASCTVFPL